jgi:hypothetical protein
MGTPLVTTAATILCAHGGMAQIIPVNTRVKAGGAFVVTQACTVLIAGCPFVVPPGTPMPCVPAQWTVTAVRVKVMGAPAVTESSVGMNTGIGPPLPLIIASPGQENAMGT